jgi:mono/diheme cytochrome c family protein
LLTNPQPRWIFLSLAGLSILTLGACRQDMQDQPKYKPLGETAFFPDHRESRPNLANTVARGDLRDGDSEFYTGKTAKDPNADIDVFPIPVTKDLIERGHQRFDVFCSPCHGRLGNGLGMIVRRGFKQPPSYHIDRLRNAPVGHFFDVITNGYGAMYNYSIQITPHDRWAIISYIRALQYSESQKADQLSTDARAKLPAQPNPDEEPMFPPLPSGQQLPAGSTPPSFPTTPTKQNLNPVVPAPGQAGALNK